MSENNKNVYKMAIIHTVIIGLSFMFVKIALQSSNPFDLLAYRFSIAFLAVLISIGFKWVKVRYSKENLLKIIPIALLYPLAFFGFQTFGLQYTSSAEAAILSAITPVFTMILASIFLKEKTNLYQKLSILVSVFGVIYITMKNGANVEFGNFKGSIFLLLSCLSIAGYSVMARKYTKNFTNVELSYMMIFISFVCFNAISIGKHAIDGTLNAFFAPLGNPSFVVAVLYLGVLSSLVTSLLNNYILSKLEASKMSVFSNLGTVITIIAGAVFLKEEVHYYHIIGSILIIGGVLGVNFLDKAPSRSNDS